MAIVLQGRVRDLGGFNVARILPNAQKKMVGPFIFMDHMGPARFKPGEGIDVRPHPHIGLSTLTYLLQGSMLHRDSLGNQMEILPGEVNWMTAGSGIVHSERETMEVKAAEHGMDGLQCWVALPQAMAEIAPSFTHVKREQLPHSSHKGVFMRLIAGEAAGMTSPVKTYSPMFFLDVIAKGGSEVARPNPQQECLLYLISGELMLGNEVYLPGSVLLLEEEACVTAQTHCRFVLLGGEKWEHTPFLDWNFVSFDKARLVQAREDWRMQRFPLIPGDSSEYTPLPD